MGNWPTGKALVQIVAWFPRRNQDASCLYPIWTITTEAAASAKDENTQSVHDRLHHHLNWCPGTTIGQIKFLKVLSYLTAHTQEHDVQLRTWHWPKKKRGFPAGSMKRFLLSRSAVWLMSKEVFRRITRDLTSPCNKYTKSIQCTAISSYPVTSLDNKFVA